MPYVNHLILYQCVENIILTKKGTKSVQQYACQGGSQVFESLHPHKFNLKNFYKNYLFLSFNLKLARISFFSKPSEFIVFFNLIDAFVYKALLVYFQIGRSL